MVNKIKKKKRKKEKEKNPIPLSPWLARFVDKRHLLKSNTLAPAPRGFNTRTGMYGLPAAVKRLNF